jgi:riboflavin kinase/FMN adenylyltransferase
VQHVRQLADVQVTRSVALSIGSFDGVHRGHQYLIARLVAAADAAGRTPAVLTFYPHPRQVLRGWEPGYYLTDPAEKAELLSRYGIELVVTHPFDETVRQMRARAFVEELREHLRLADLWVGPDFALGYRREGDVPFLRALGAEMGFEVHVVEEKLALDGAPVSSERIREALRAGDVAGAAESLGRQYSLVGTVVHGDHRGRTIGFPTANLRLPAERTVPGRGVYGTWAVVGGERFASVTNIGVRPTFDGTQATTVEAHLLDFSGDLYDQALALEFVARIRDEQRFAGVAELVAQIKQDVETGKSLLTG